MKTFFKGTLLLIGAAFIGECIEFLINMVLAKQLGEKGMGMYMSILPTIILVIILASIELPISISKFIAEREQKYHRSMLHHVTRLTIIFTSIIIALMTIVAPFIPLFHAYHPYIKWLIILLIPIISFSSIARGYFMGVQSMGKIAFANFFRKLLQLFMLVFIYQFFSFTTETAIFIALCTLVASDLVVFLYLAYEYFLQIKTLNNRENERLSGKDVRQSLLAVSLPTTLLRIFHAATHAIHPFLIKAALINAGLTASQANEHFGLLAGVALTIGFFPAFIAHSLLIVLIPTVSEANSKKDIGTLQALLQQVMRFTALYSVPSILIFYFFGDPLTHLFFESSDATIYLQMLWPYFLFHFFIIPMQAYLIGLGLVKDALYHSIWSTIVSYTSTYFLGSMHNLQMDGVIIGMNMGAVLLTMMHYITICKKMKVSIFLLKPLKHY